MKIVYITTLSGRACLVNETIIGAIKDIEKDFALNGITDRTGKNITRELPDRLYLGDYIRAHGYNNIWYIRPLEVGS